MKKIRVCDFLDYYNMSSNARVHCHFVDTDNDFVMTYDKLKDGDYTLYDLVGKIDISLMKLESVTVKDNVITLYVSGDRHYIFKHREVR